MSDIFISYSHKDATFVRDLASKFEAEGFSVWWDHTIPPGKTWDDVIARGISDAKACVVVWSADSVVSDWVKEEATLAKESAKYLPVQIGPDLPPMGFRRIQAADLRHWAGDTQDVQWRMLIAAAHTFVRPDGEGPPPAVPAQEPLRGRVQEPLRARGVTGATGEVNLSRRPANSRQWVLVALAAVAVGGVVWAVSRHTGGEDPAADSPANSAVGTWRGWAHLDIQGPNSKNPWAATFQSDGTFIGQNALGIGMLPYSQSGSTVTWLYATYTFTGTVEGNRMTGSILENNRRVGDFAATR